MKFCGQTILITGGTSGIGYALAESFLAAGNTVLVCGRRADRLAALQKKHPEILCMSCDVSSPEDRERLFIWAKEHHVNALFNNAGIQRNVDFKKGLEDLNDPRELTVNTESVIMLTALFVPYLLTLERAFVFTTTSGLTYMTETRANVPMYLVSKSAIHSYTVLLRRQLRDTGIRVIEVVPPIVDTEINPEGRKLRKMASRGILPEQFAEYVMWGLEADLETIFAKDEDYPRPLALRGVI